MRESPWLAPFRLLWRTLTFRATAGEYESATWHSYLVGFLITWLAGLGRTWDDPEASPLRVTGLGSVGYVVVLAGLITIFALPLSKRRIGYRATLLLVLMTAAPALIYAIPVERWTDMHSAQVLNLNFLLVVASYRVCMFFRFLYSCARMAWFDTILAGLLPLMLIIVLVTFFGLTGKVLDIMGGLHGDENAQSMADDIVFMLTGFSCVGFVPGLVAFGVRASSINRAPVSSDE